MVNINGIGLGLSDLGSFRLESDAFARYFNSQPKVEPSPPPNTDAETTPTTTTTTTTTLPPVVASDDEASGEAAINNDDVTAQEAIDAFMGSRLPTLSAEPPTPRQPDPETMTPDEVREAAIENYQRYGGPRGDFDLTPDWAHTTLDAVGLIPGLGEPADATNAVLHTIDGDFADAGLSAAGMIPIGGWFATAGRWANRAQRGSDAGEVVVRGADDVPIHRVNDGPSTPATTIPGTNDGDIYDDPFYDDDQGGWGASPEPTRIAPKPDDIPGRLPLDDGARQWAESRKNKIDPEAARRAAHRIKGGDKLSGARDDYRVDVETGEVYDPNGQPIGNIADELSND